MLRRFEGLRPLLGSVAVKRTLMGGLELGLTLRETKEMKEKQRAESGVVRVWANITVLVVFALITLGYWCVSFLSPIEVILYVSGDSMDHRRGPDAAHRYL